MKFEKYVNKHFSFDVKEKPLQDTIEILYEAIITGKFIFSCGNGGSGYSASHFTQDLSKMCNAKAFSLTDNWGLVTAFANDVSYESVFVGQLHVIDNPFVLVAVSCSGNSENVVSAAHYTMMIGNKVIGFTGRDGGKLAKLSNVNVNVPTESITIAESTHSIFFHYIISEIMERL